MCGIAGIFELGHEPHPVEALRAEVRRMSAALAQRGPDQQAEFADRRCALGIARLIINGSSTSNLQPAVSDASALVFNGEIYNFAALASRHGRCGEVEALQATLDDAGTQGLAQLEGMFALAHYRRADSSLLLARDALGKKPLYFARAGQRFVFASTLKSLGQCLPQVELREAAIHEYLVFRSVGGDRCVMSGVETVPPGSWVRLHSDGRVERGVYWVPPSEVDPTPADMQARLHGCMQAAVETRLHYPGNIALFLSGGFDSSLVATLAARARRGERLVALAAGYEIDQGADESRFAADMARSLGLPFERVLVPSARIPELMAEAAQHIEDPVQDPVLIPTLLLAKRAKQFANVVMTGDGADEVWGGYERFDHMPASFEQYLPRTMVFQPQELGLSEPPASYLDQLTLSAALLRDTGDVVHRLELRNRMKNYHLSRIDKITMSQALEARCPFLDKSVVELGLRCGFHEKRPDGRPKGLLIDAFRGLLPDWLIQRRKQPFSLPLVALLNGPLKACLHDTVHSAGSVIHRYVDAKMLLARFAAQSDQAQAHKLWSLLFLDTWYRSFWLPARAR